MTKASPSYKSRNYQSPYKYVLYNYYYKSFSECSHTWNPGLQRIFLEWIWGWLFSGFYSGIWGSIFPCTQPTIIFVIMIRGSWFSNSSEHFLLFVCNLSWMTSRILVGQKKRGFDYCRSEKEGQRLQNILLQKIYWNY